MMRWGARSLRLCLPVVCLVALVACTPLAPYAGAGTVSPTLAQGEGAVTSPSPSLAAAIPTPSSAQATPTLAPTKGIPNPENPCGWPTIVAPTPAPDPGHMELDQTTGLHVTGDMQIINLATYRLKVTGLVEQPLALTYAELHCLPKVYASPALDCAGLFTDYATWGGTPVREVLALARVRDGAQVVDFVSADGYTTFLTLDRALDRANFLAYEWQGQPLPRLHGFPLRVVVPDAGGGQWNKWVVELRVHS